ncbi:S1-C subfamily serine protease [Microbacterium endophyticum]|uniref:S1-C subfamily serine protease n=1 Tax=Microbacterium endophyticum TaxID=1526412 RepID=A0A7W4V0V3_9MICO|nr:MarP family serine protease [Microbacterium endophyticum]MBB2974806.1 S1-C subfamily serine protease [Microbacterium endophyticum]NIK37103.1 S1-C subfamily serine protease [Microbacterium endophyticum]
MLVVDVIAIVVLVLALLIGFRRGLLSSLGVLGGLVLGCVAVFWLVPLLTPHLPELIPDAGWRGVASIVLPVLIVVVCASVGSAIGGFLRRGVDRTPLRGIERIFGGALGVIVAALTLSLVGQSIAVAGVPVVPAAVSSSRVLGVIDSLTPEPVEVGLAKVQALLRDEALPQLGDVLDLGLALGTSEPAPEISLDDPALTEAAQSVARVSGAAYLCGTTSSGTGFVISPERVLTNAHVVAGVDAPMVEFPGESAKEGRVVYFDAVDDLAVIAVDDLGVAPLTVAPSLDADAEAVVQGYPYGGPFSMVGARVISRGSASVPDIYGTSTSPREIYALTADVYPGNSGGPLLSLDGDVVGVIFARADNGESIGYAMTPAEFLPVIAESATSTERVDTGACTT